MFLVIALGVIYTLAKGMGFKPLPWVVMTLVLGVIVNAVVYVMTGWIVGGTLVAIPIGFIMSIVHREQTGRGVFEEYSVQIAEADRVAEQFNAEHYPDDLEILRSYADESFQVPFMKLRNHLHEAGITTYVRQAGITNLMVREADYERASELAEGYL